MNITNEEVIQRIEFGIKRLKEESLSASEQAKILRAIGAISSKRNEQIQEQLKEELVNG